MITTTVAFIDDHPILLAGLARLFSSGSDMNVIAIGRTADDIVEIAQTVRPRVMVVDLGMPGNAIESIAKVTSRSSDTKILVFTASECIDTAIATLEAGALGFVLKGSSLEELRDAIERVSAGETYITPSFASKVVAALRKEHTKRAAPRVTFSKREEDVLRLLLRGNTNRQIAIELLISEKTVKHHMTVLIQKLNVRNRVEVLLAAQELASNGSLAETARPTKDGS
jgi:two-component system, NarL family, nitrate/nitrite response regulator NarL